MGVVRSPSHLNSGRNVWASAAGQDIAHQLEHGPGAADRDPQVMQELGVHVADGAGDVGLERAEQVQQHRRDSRGSRHLGRQRTLDLARVVARLPPGRRQCGVQRGEAFRLETRGARQDLATRSAWSW